MTLVELNAITQPTQQHLASAREDLRELEQVVAKSAAALQRAESNVEKIKGTEASIRARIAAVKEKLVTERRRAYLRTSVGEDPGPLFDDAEKLEKLQKNLDKSLDYLLLYPAADCTTTLIAAQIAERTATANLWESQAIYKRLAAILKFVEVAALDPGVGAVFGETPVPERGYRSGPDKVISGAWSDQRLAEVEQIRKKDIPALRVQLETHVEQTEQKRNSLVGTSIWN